MCDIVRVSTRDTDQSLKVSISSYRHRSDLVQCGNGSGETTVVEEEQSPVQSKNYIQKNATCTELDTFNAFQKESAQESHRTVNQLAMLRAVHTSVMSREAAAALICRLG